MTRKLRGKGIFPYWCIALITQDRVPPKNTRPASHPWPNAVLQGFSRMAIRRGTRAIQARKSRSYCGKLRTSRVPDRMGKSSRCANRPTLAHSRRRHNWAGLTGTVTFSFHQKVTVPLLVPPDGFAALAMTGTRGAPARVVLRSDK